MDKLVNKKDKEVAEKIIEERCLEIFSDCKNDIEKHLLEKEVLFCDFLQYPMNIM